MIDSGREDFEKQKNGAAGNCPTIVVRRAAGDMMDRWLKRWSNNLARYVNLNCVKLILPWSTPSMRRPGSAGSIISALTTIL